MAKMLLNQLTEEEMQLLSDMFDSEDNPGGYEAHMKLKNKQKKEEEDDISPAYIDDIEEELESEKKFYQVWIENGVVHGFNYDRIPDYCFSGIFINSDYYTVASPEVATPYYISMSAAKSSKYDRIKSSIVRVMPKWKGEKLMVLRVTSNKEIASIFFVKNKAYFIHESAYACQAIEIEDGVVILEGFGEDMNAAEEEMTFCDDDLFDGYIYITDEKEYRMKTERTYDLLVKDNKLVDNDGVVIGSVFNQKDSTIVEVDENLTVLRVREGKKSANNTKQVREISSSATLCNVPELRAPKVFGVYGKVQDYVVMSLNKILKQKRKWNENNVARTLFGVSCQFDAKTIYDILAPYNDPIIKRVKYEEGDFRIEKEGNTVTIYTRKLKALTLEVFLREAIKRNITIHRVKENLVNKGYVFTPADLAILKETFFRGYKSKFVFNQGYMAKCRKISVYCVLDFIGKSDLPYMKNVVVNEQVIIYESNFKSPFKSCTTRFRPITIAELYLMPNEMDLTAMLKYLASLGQRDLDCETLVLGINLIGKRLK